ncbi:MAG TPA: carboxypeptidase-like regulatory domain-containing protein [Acidobacteriaceae bacterium]|nr:carboxypeptidase-like regulatory domain-containing protein [Acidobacteriaceae bacterium]
MRFVLALLCCLPVCLIQSAGAQQIAGAIPDAPVPAAGTQVRAETQVQAEATATRTLSGVVTDMDGALVPGATVTLLENFAVKGRSVVADANGHFSFSDVAAGPYTLTISAPGMQRKTQTGTLNPDESVELPPIALGAAASEEVEVSGLTQQEIAEVQMKQEEKQRLVGLVPNFYVSYVWNAAPMTPKQKYKLAVRSIIDPATFAIAAGFAGIEQATDEYSGFGTGWEGYGKRYGALLADGAIGGMLGGAVLPVLFHQDPRYFYKGTGTKWQRTWYAIGTAVIARGDNGKWQPGYAAVLGDFASGAISNLYYPASNRNGAELTIVNGFVAIGSNAVGNILQEFVLKKISTGVKKATPVTAQP